MRKVSAYMRHIAPPGLDRFNQYPRYYNQFRKYNDHGLEFFECKELDVRIFNLFIQSIVWRLSVCYSHAFSGLKLHLEDEEELRVQLANSTFHTQTSLSKYLNSVLEFSNHPHIIFRPYKKLRPPKSHLSAATLINSVHQLHLVDYVVFYYTDPTLIVPGLMKINNSSFGRNVRVGLINEEQWEKFNFDQIREWKTFSTSI